MTFTIDTREPWHSAVTEKRYLVRNDEKLTAFLELERAIHAFVVDLIV